MSPAACRSAGQSTSAFSCLTTTSKPDRKASSESCAHANKRRPGAAHVTKTAQADRRSLEKVSLCVSLRAQNGRRLHSLHTHTMHIPHPASHTSPQNPAGELPTAGARPRGEVSRAVPGPRRRVCLPRASHCHRKHPETPGKQTHPQVLQGQVEGSHRGVVVVSTVLPLMNSIQLGQNLPCFVRVFLGCSVAECGAHGGV